VPPAADVHRILEIATTAISPYNTQPWRFRVDGDTIDVYILRTKNFFLKLQGVSHMTLGCLLENLLVGARHVGYRGEYRFLPGTLGIDEPCARVKLIRDRSPEPQDVSHVLARTTNRKLYERTPLPADLRAEIEALCVDPNIALIYSEGRGQERLSALLARLESVRISNYKMTREALEYIRFTEEEMHAKPEGLDLRTLEFEPRAVRLMRPLERRRAHRLLSTFGAVRIAARRHREQLVNSAGILTYTLQDREPADFVTLGMVIQRTLNRLALAGVQSMSVLSGLYLLDVLGSNPEIFSRRELRLLRRARVEIADFYGVPDRDVVYIVRAGFAEEPAHRQSRRPVAELLLEPAEGEPLPALDAVQTSATSPRA
jgi:hypothetical protein